ASFTAAIESQPTFIYSFDAHYDSMLWPLLVFTVGAERDFARTALGFDAWFGIISLGGGPYVRFVLDERPRARHDLEVRASWLPAQTVSATLLYSLSLRLRKR